ncbi:protein halfway [Diorhabda sublineata]|uniref:protein halfway n=1 Tax=Diorhabda sublineata TaxID=1163346 RepID=UPI0024E0AFA5|nr:protein halfway [Diorhabda sublineata]XP_056632044.1 protein halfway [Diorhabda sublineata]
MILRTLLTIFLCTLPTWSRLPEELREVREDDSRCYQQCFYQPEDSCPSPDDPCRCRQLSTCKKAVICCDVNDETLKDQLRCRNLVPNEIEALHIRNATLEVLNLTLAEWKHLRSMAITDGKIKTVSGAFSKMTAVSCLNLSSNGITEFQKRSLCNLFSLSFLDLSHNNLTEVPNFKLEGHITLDIVGNPMILCQSVKDTFKRANISFNNENNTYCASQTNYDWFTSKYNVLVSELRRIYELEDNCVPNCTCNIQSLNFGEGMPRVFTVDVNCSEMNLLTLPKRLPPYTVKLDVSNNNITSLKELSDSSYNFLKEFNADNNQIESLKLLEATGFRYTLEVLSLRNNKIKYIDPYLVEVYCRTSKYMRQFNLGLNKLSCDCATITDFKMWLETKISLIVDYKEIKCEDTDISIIDLDPSKYCHSSEDWTIYIYWIIAVEVFLLISLVAKVTYDYWVFKTAGYLPWPASKMPKLPCDWLCE